MMSLLRSTAAWTARHALPVAAAATIVVAAAGGGVAAAVASHATPPMPASQPTGTSTDHPAAAARHGLAHTARRAELGKLLAILTRDTGQSLASIETQLKAGRSLDQVAGSNAARVRDDVVAALRTVLDRAVGTGRITSAEETTRLAHARSLLEKVMAEPGTQLLHQLEQLRQQATGHAPGNHRTTTPAAAPATPGA